MSTNSPDYAPLFKRALRTLDELQAKLNALERPLTEPIAVIGMGCRFPGGADNPETFWPLLREGFDGITEVPPERWDMDAYFDPTPGTPGKMYTRHGGFLKDVDRFDPHFFGISPREALSMDPQQRLLLEVCWEAIEDAGLAPLRLAGSPTGVFLGISSFDYPLLLARAGESADTYTATGTAHSISAGRVSYLLGLRGPNVPLDTACSSSLVAVHLACQSLRLGESRLALAGGVNLTLSPESTVAISQARMAAADGRCKTFDASADGYVRGEGCGVVVLKRLSDALADGDRILALIRGTAVNQDGRSSGITAPNGAAQEAVVREALARAALSGSQIHYVEAHGTGTALGDPIEVRALGAVLGDNRSKDRPLLIGSVKTNIGHLEAAAGVAGLIKAVLALQHEEIPAHLHLKTPNPLIPWDDLPIRVVTERTPWPRGQEKRIASVSSFGFSGTNAHVILEEAPPIETRPTEVERPVHLLTLSAKAPRALQELATRFEGRLEAALSLPDVCFTANAGRAHFAERFALVASSSAEARVMLEAAGVGRDATGLFRGEPGERGEPPVAFLFTGQGAQYAGMGRQLYETSPTFRKALERCDELLRPHLDRPLLSVLYPKDGEASPLDETAYTQPALFALEYALAELWRSWGIEPALVLGHSVGEYVAACVAGVFSLEDGLKLIAQRGRLMQALPPGGEMAAVFADEARVREAIGPYSREVSLAAVNGPESVVISGEGGAIREVTSRLGAAGIKSQRLTVSHAFHSPRMEPMLAAFEQVVRGVTFAPPRIGIVSNVTGGLATPEELADPRYWRRHVREAVRFSAGMTSLRQQGCEVFLELGPSPTLLGMGARCLPEGTGLWLPSLRKGRDDWRQMLESLAALYVHGVEVDWAGFDRDYPRRKVALPTYPFQQERYWLEGATRGARLHPRLDPTGAAQDYPLLGRRLRSALRHLQYESEVGCDSPPFLKDHAFFGSPVFPGAGYVEMALAAISATGGGTPCLEDLALEEPLLLPEGGTRTVQFVLHPEGSFEVFSLGGSGDQAEWRRHASGRVSLLKPSESPAPGALEEARGRIGRELDVGKFYRDLRAHGVEYGPAFQGIEAAWSGADEAIGRARVPDDLVPEAGSYRVHPVLLDAGFQLLGAALAADFGAGDSDVFMPTAVRRLALLGPIGDRVWIHLRRVPGRQDGRTLSADIRFFSQEGHLVATLEGLEMRRVKSETLTASHARSLAKWIYEVVWEEKPVAVDAPTAAGGHWLILAETRGLAGGLAQHLEARGARAILATPGAAYRCLGEDRYELDPGRREDFEALVRDVAAGGGKWCGVVHLWASEAQGSTSASVVEAQRKSLTSALHLVQGLAALEVKQTPPLWLVTRGAQAVRTGEGVSPGQTSLWGLGPTIALEIPKLRCLRVDLEADEGGGEPLLNELLATDGEDQVAYRAGVRFVARMARAKASHASLPALAEGQALQLQIPTRGILDNLKLLRVDRRPPGRGEVEVEVEASGLNFRDVLNALGMYPGDPGPLGGECAGRIVAVGEGVEGLRTGDEVLGLAAASFSTYVTTRAEVLARKPAGLSLEESATIPIVFLTAHYGLNRLARMRAGERVLIHAAAGGVGMAAVQLAQRAGAEIFATAGSPEKRELLRSLGVHHVMDSRSVAFADEILSATGGEGIDVVLNSLADAFIPKSLSLLRQGGRFLEIGKRGIWTPAQVRQAKPDVEYHVIYLGGVAETQPDLIREMLGELVEAFEAGRLKPLPRTVFSVRDAVDAFRYMAQAKHVGKVVLRQDATRGRIRPYGSYLITGGLGGLGLTVARWLVEQGARHLVLLGRREPTAEARQAIAAMEAQGARVRVFQADVSRREDVTRVLAEVEASLPPLRGIVHAAGVLDDGVLLQQDWGRFARVMEPKVEGAWNLHVLTRHSPLDFFVLFSSMASLMGSPGQGNYAAANAFLDGLAWRRRSEGRPGLSINWGPWAQVGMAAGLLEKDQRRHVEKGVEPIPPGDGARAFGQLLRDGAGPQAMVAPIRWGRLLGQFPSGDVPAFLQHQVQESSTATTAVAGPAQGPPLLRQLEEAPMAQRRDLILSHVRELALKVLGLPPLHPISARKPLSEMGLDSLMAVELRNAFSTSLGTTLPATLLFDYPTIEDLARHLGERWVGTAPTDGREAASAAEGERTRLVAEVKHLTDAEVESLIEKELETLRP